MTKVQRLSEKQLLDGLKKGIITINDYYCDDVNELTMNFYSDKYDEELDNIEVSMPLDLVIAELNKWHEGVFFEEGKFYSYAATSSWEDKNGNYEEDGEIEEIEENLVIDDLYCLLIQQKPEIKYQLSLSAPVIIDFNQQPFSTTEWYNKTAEEKQAIALEEFYHSLGIINPYQQIAK